MTKPGPPCCRRYRRVILQIQASICPGTDSRPKLLMFVLVGIASRAPIFIPGTGFGFWFHKIRGSSVGHESGPTKAVAGGRTLARTTVESISILMACLIGLPGRNSPIRIVPPTVDRAEPPWPPIVRPRKYPPHQLDNACCRPAAIQRREAWVWMMVYCQAREMRPVIVQNTGYNKVRRHRH